MEQFTIFYESLRGLWWILSTNTLQCVLVIYTHFWTYNLKKTVNVVLLNFTLVLNGCFCSLNLDTYLVFHVCVFILFFLIDGSKYSHWQILQKWKIIRTTNWTTQWTTQCSTYFLSSSLFLPFQTLFAAFIRVDNAIAKQRNVS